jgi:tripartite-type tricarboxylate transporter receptor subunit TctC
MRFLRAFCLSLLFAMPAVAQSYPDRPLRFVIPFPAGGATDVVGRHVAQELSNVLGQPVVVDNKPGASAIVGAQAVAAAPADGYTILFATSSVLAINAATREKLSYDPEKSFTPVSLIGLTPMIVLVGADSPYNTLAELIAAAKAKPNGLRYAAVSDTIRLAAEMLNERAGVKIESVPYRGAAEAYGDFYANRIEVMFDPIPTGYPLVRDKRAKGLAVTTAKRSEMAPQVPTVAEAANLPGFDVSIWYSVVLPQGTPRPIVDRLNKAVVKALQNAELRAKLSGLGVEARPSSPEELAAFVASELARWRAVARSASLVRAD